MSQIIWILGSVGDVNRLLLGQGCLYSKLSSGTKFAGFDSPAWKARMRAKVDGMKPSTWPN